MSDWPVGSAFHVKIRRDGMWPVCWTAKVSGPKGVYKQFDTFTCGRAIKKAKKFMREYADFDIDVGRV